MMLAEPYTAHGLNAVVSLLFAALLGVAFYFWLRRGRSASPLFNLSRYAAWIQETLASMFIELPPKRCALLPPAGATGGALLGLFLGYDSGAGAALPAMAAFALAGWQLPRLVITWLWKRRIAKIDQQFVDTLDMMANSLKSGLSFLQVIELVGRESPPPIGQEFRYILSQHKLGITLDDCLDRLAKRVPSEDIVMAVTAILTLRELGAKLSETFQSIAKTIRERKKVQAKIKAVTSQGVTQSVILSGFPYFLIAVLQFIAPEYLAPLFKTPLGWLALSGMVAMQLIGAFWMRRIIDIDV